MTEIAEYERRISFALERIGRGVEQLCAVRVAAGMAPSGTADAATEDSPAEALTPTDLGATDAGPERDAGRDAELAQLREALEAERTANAQLSERVRAIRDKQETTLSAMEKKLGQTARSLEAAQTELARLKRANADLAGANRELVEASGDPAPHLINRAMQAELEALRAARAAEAAELADILGAMAPVLGAAEAAEAARAQMKEAEEHA